MTLKDKLPDRLKCSPLLTMESDSDIETIAESIVNLSDSDGDFFKKTEKLLLMAALGYLRDWCEPSQRTIGNLISLLDAALPKDNETHTTLDNLFYEMKSGCKRVKSEDGITTLWEPSALSRCDGLTPRDSNGIDVSEDFSLTCYEGFRHAATRETRTSIVTTLLLVLEGDEWRKELGNTRQTRRPGDRNRCGRIHRRGNHLSWDDPRGTSSRRGRGDTQSRCNHRRGTYLYRLCPSVRLLENK